MQKVVKNYSQNACIQYRSDELQRSLFQFMNKEASMSAPEERRSMTV